MRVKYSAAYQIIDEVYLDLFAKRSGVPYINHIDEGLTILNHLGASDTAKEAYCVHPIFQEDKLFISHGGDVMDCIDEGTAILAMEYRVSANNYLSKHTFPDGGIKLPQYPEVVDMLIADKVQNRKDFEQYGKGNLPNSNRLDIYFKEWLEALGVSERDYEHLSGLIT